MSESAEKLVTDTVGEPPKSLASKSAKSVANKASHDKAAVAVIEMEGKRVPACGECITRHRERSAKAGKMKSLPKGLTKAKAAEFVGTNQDDLLPVNVIAMTEIERENEPRCLAYHLDSETTQ